MAKYTSYNVPAKKKKKASKKRMIVLVLLGLILLSGLLLVLDRKGIINLPFLSHSKPVQTSNGINYGPPTEQEKKETEKFKDNLGDQTAPPPAPPSSPGTKAPVTPVMTSWGASPNAQVRGYVPGINEEGGTCTATLTKDGQKVTESKTATADAQTVSCGLITIARDRLSAGTWTATLSYSSKTSEGVSTSNTVDVE